MVPSEPVGGAGKKKKTIGSHEGIPSAIRIACWFLILDIEQLLLVLDHAAGRQAFPVLSGGFLRTSTLPQNSASGLAGPQEACVECMYF